MTRVLEIVAIAVAVFAAGLALSTHIRLRRRTKRIDEVMAMSWLAIRLAKSDAPIVFLHLSDADPFFGAVIQGPGPMLDAAMSGMEDSGWDPGDHDQVEPERLYKSHE